MVMVLLFDYQEGYFYRDVSQHRPASEGINAGGVRREVRTYLSSNPMWRVETDRRSLEACSVMD